VPVIRHNPRQCACRGRAADHSADIGSKTGILLTVKGLQRLRWGPDLKPIHKEIEAPGATRASLEIPEARENPIMLQGDHGPVSFRRMYVRRLDGAVR